MEGQSFSFLGDVVIKIKFEKKTDMIKLHAKDLKLSNEPVQLTCPSGNVNKTYNLGISGPNEKSDILTLTISKTDSASIIEGLECFLAIKYEGKDSGDKRGFYRTSYKNKDGLQKWMASTLFEPIGARQVFPCWDEPDFKATFTIAIEHSIKYQVLSNMHEISTQIDPKDRTIRKTVFAASPIMSSYLIAFAIGDFIRVDSDNLDFEVWTRRNIVDNAKYAMQIGPTILKALENYTSVPYKDHKFLKMESLAVPELAAGAMENWGLVIYSERSFLYGGNMSSTMQKEVVTAILAHELAHQWFGNLITAKWWDDIWLNEGFANYFQYVITDMVEPTWRMMDKFVVKNLQGIAFAADCKKNSHAMYQKIENSDDIRNAFDNITYSKSGSVLRMMSYVFGEEKFKTGLRNYIKNNAFGSVTRTDLITELNNVANNSNSEKILKNWIETPGYPVITVIRDYKTETITITQSRFLDTNDTVPKEKYWIPLNHVTEGDFNFQDTNVTDWFDPDSPTKIIMSPNTTNKFIIFNKQQFGYYRVNYDIQNWQMIIKYLQTKNHTDIHVLNRAQLIDDSLNLAKVGKLGYNITLSLMEYLKVETDFIPWSAAWRGIEYILKFVKNTDMEVEFKNYVLKISEKLMKEVQTVLLNETNHVMRLKRTEALKWACNLGSKSCQSETNEQLIKWLDNPEAHAFFPDNVEWTMCAGVRTANLSTWNRLWEKYMKEKDSKILMALGCTSNSQILNEYLSKVFSQNQTEHLSEVFKAIYTGSSEGVNVVLDYMTKQYKKISTLANYTKDQLKSDFTSLGQRLTTKVQYDLLKKFVDDKGNDSNGIANEALQLAGNNLESFSVPLTQMKQFFKQNDPPSNNNSSKNVIFSASFLIISFLISQIY